MRRQLSSYSSSSSTSSSPDFYPSLSTDGSYSSACGGGGGGEGPPPSHQPLFFRRNSSMESIARGYESPEEEEEMMEDESEQHHTPSSAAAATSTDGNGAHLDGSSGGTLGSAVGCQRTPRNLAGVPRTIVEDEDQALAAAVLAPIYADLAIARTRSMPLPRHEVASPTAAAAAAAGAAAIAASASSSSSSSSSLLPGAQPGFGSSQSWTPGLAPPLPYAHITPLHSPLDDASGHNDDNHNSGLGAYGDDQEQSDDLPPPTIISFAPLLPQSAAAAAESDDLPPHPMFDSSAYSHISRAPPPSRAPSLVRQKGVYVEATSRTFSLPLDYASRLREQQRMAREVQEREELFQQQLQAAGALLSPLQQQQPHTPTPPTITRYVRRRD